MRQGKGGSRPAPGLAFLISGVPAPDRAKSPDARCGHTPVTCSTLTAGLAAPRHSEDAHYALRGAGSYLNGP